MLEGITEIGEEHFNALHLDLVKQQNVKLEITIREMARIMDKLVNETETLRKRLDDIEGRAQAEKMGIKISEPRRF